MISSPARRLRLAAAIVLVVGLIASAVVYLTATRNDAAGSAYRIIGGQVYSTDDSSSSDRQSERLGGKALVQTAAFSRWMASLWHGERLAWTLAALSVIVAGLCFHISGLMDEDGDKPAGG